MATFRYRLLRTIRDEVVGVAVQPPWGGLMLRLGQRDLDFEAAKSPRLESLDHYIETIADKPDFKKLELHHAMPVTTIDLDRFISLALFFNKVKDLDD